MMLVSDREVEEISMLDSVDMMTISCCSVSPSSCQFDYYDYYGGEVLSLKS